MGWFLQFSRRDIMKVMPYSGSCITILRVLYYHTMDLVLPYYGSCITILWVLYYHTMGLVLPYYGSCITIQWVLYYHTMGLVLPYNRVFPACNRAFPPYIAFGRRLSCTVNGRFVWMNSCFGRALKKIQTGSVTLQCPVYGLFLRQRVRVSFYCPLFLGVDGYWNLFQFSGVIRTKR